MDPKPLIPGVSIIQPRVGFIGLLASPFIVSLFRAYISENVVVCIPLSCASEILPVTVWAIACNWMRGSRNINDNMNKEVKLKDKFIKIRVRYSGKDLAVISALKTLYSISYA